MPRYALLIQHAERSLGDLSPSEQQRTLSRYFAWIDDLVERDVMQQRESLREGGRILRIIDGEVIDGPYTECKEVIGGFFIVDVEDEETARSIARTCPALEYGDAVQVREIRDVELGRR